MNRLDEILESMTCQDCTGYPNKEHKKAKLAIKAELEELIGEDEGEDISTEEFNRWSLSKEELHRNQLRAQLRQRLDTWIGGEK